MCEIHVVVDGIMEDDHGTRYGVERLDGQVSQELHCLPKACMQEQRGIKTTEGNKDSLP